MRGWNIFKMPRKWNSCKSGNFIKRIIILIFPRNWGHLGLKMKTSPPIIFFHQFQIWAHKNDRELAHFCTQSNRRFFGSEYCPISSKAHLTVASTILKSCASTSGPSGPRLFPGYGWSTRVQPTCFVWPPTVLIQHYSEPKCYVTNPKSKILVVHQILQMIII